MSFKTSVVFLVSHDSYSSLTVGSVMPVIMLVHRTTRLLDASGVPIPIKLVGDFDALVGV